MAWEVAQVPVGHTLRFQRPCRPRCRQHAGCRTIEGNGLGSTVVGVLIEVPVMLSLFALASTPRRHWPFPEEGGT
ncbi:hypothetical protein DL240_02870 [Lujinxingia litoralis]|uniref:Uncharacterized protein n=1 Tax=Lujinxingia litoralis TaxID=2211119 RepID=A0A328CC25_9DELT|nr:hypothetical protein DL240_02870 [Lujinxingia litoralis]